MLVIASLPKCYRQIHIFIQVLKEDTNVSSVLNVLVNVTAPSTTNNNSLLLGDLETVNKVMSKITEVIEVNIDNVNNVADVSHKYISSCLNANEFVHLKVKYNFLKKHVPLSLTGFLKLCKIQITSV
jgi:hypothetical protein